MSKYTAEQFEDEARNVENGCAGIGWERRAKMLRYAAHLAEQAEWPSDDIAAASDTLRDVLETYGYPVSETAAIAALTYALQSVRPPVGVVSDEMRELYAAASKGFHTSESSGVDSYYTHKSKFHTLKDLQDFSAAWTKAMLASRHAPAKDYL